MVVEIERDQILVIWGRCCGKEKGFWKIGWSYWIVNFSYVITCLHK